MLCCRLLTYNVKTETIYFIIVGGGIVLDHSASHRSCDLMANFLTHSYFNLLEKYLYYIQHPTDTSARQSILQATQSFLFMFTNNPHGHATLKKCIFDYYKPYDELIANKTLRFQRLSRIRKTYSRTLLKLQTDDSYLSANTYLIHNYYYTLFSYFKKSGDIPSLLKASTVESFIAETKKLKLSLLGTPL